MAAFVKFEVLSENIAEKVHNFDTDTLNIYLSNAAPNVATHTIKTDIADITNQNGYAPADTLNSTSRTGGTTSVLATDKVWTAAAGSFGPFRYVILYNDTPAAPLDPLIAYWDYGSAITVLDTETFTVDFGSNKLMDIA
jgi:hypothetical protein